MPDDVETPARSSRHTLALLPAFVLAGGLYGFATSSIPSPHGVSAFWIGNLCAPWLVLAFLAGRTQRSWRWAVAAGALIDIACVVGFYLNALTLDPLELGLPASTSMLTIATTSFGRWLNYIAYWLLAAVLGGAIYGALGFWWRRSRLLVAGLALAAPFLVEPVLWPLRNGYYQGPWPLWAVEVVVGLLIVGGIMRERRRGSRISAPASN